MIADLRQMAAQGVERRRALPDHELARSMAHQRRLVLHRAHGNEALARTPCRLANRRRVGCVVLVAPDIGLHVRRRNELHREAEIQQLPPPVMRRGTGLHRHDAPRKRVEKLQKRSAIDRAGNDDRARRVDRVNAEDPLGQIKPHARDRREIDDRLATDGSLPDGAFNDDHLGTLDAVRGAVHPISKVSIWPVGHAPGERPLFALRPSTPSRGCGMSGQG